MALAASVNPRHLPHFLEDMDMQPENVAQEIMNGNSVELMIDYTEWKSASYLQRAQAFDDLLANYKAMEYDNTLSAEQNYRAMYMELGDKLEGWLAHWAKQEQMK